MQSLQNPLSWKIGFHLKPIIDWVRLPMSKYIWWSTVELPYQVSAVAIIREALLSNQHFVIRGANQELASIFESNGGHSMQTGMEAAIDLTTRTTDRLTWNRKSNRELKRRALRFGQVIRHDSISSFPDLAELRFRSNYRNKPELKGLFLTKSNQWYRAYSFNVGGTVVGLLTLSRRSIHSFHTEILMRSVNAPIGTMEALVLFAIQDLISEGAVELSLGECPFVMKTEPLLKFHWVEKIMRKSYNSKGLYNFKAKFVPQWRPVYVCSSKRLIVTLIDLFFVTHVANLLFQNWFRFYWRS
ncbi:MAG: DUF2156 domain-containing protein [Leptonema sp. (in: Bacteria)]|nr:DUF2156 domain-containing protein [Leptonema sp. (in: bacteria)]